MMPMAVISAISSPNAPLMTEPVDSTMTSSTPRIALMRVKTLARTMSDTLRAARVGTSLVLPSATRWATSASVRPVATTVVNCALFSSRKRSSEERPLLERVVILERQLVAVERGLGNRSRRRIFGDPIIGEDAAVPMIQGHIQCRDDGELQLAVFLGDARRAPVVVVVGADVGGQRPTARGTGRRLLSDQRARRFLHLLEEITVELVPV